MCVCVAPCSLPLGCAVRPDWRRPVLRLTRTLFGSKRCRVMKSQCSRALHHGYSQESAKADFSVIACDPHWPEEARCLERVLATSTPCIMQVGEAWETSRVVRVDGFRVHEADITPLTWLFKGLMCFRPTCGGAFDLLRPVGVWIYKRNANGDTKFTERAQKLTPVRSSSSDERLDFSCFGRYVHVPSPR